MRKPFHYLFQIPSFPIPSFFIPSFPIPSFSIPSLILPSFLILSFLIPHSPIVAQSWADSQFREIAFTNVDVIPMTSAEQILLDQTVIIRSGKIQKIGPADKVRPNSNALLIDGTGKYLMPGIAEMHAHIPVPSGDSDSLVRKTLLLYLANGITTIRGMLGDPYHLRLKRQVEKGEVLGPRIYTSSPSLNGGTVHSKEEARDKVGKYKNEGYDFLKIHPGLSREVFDEIAATARQLNIPFSGHVPTAVGIRHAIASGYASIDHLDGYVEGLVPASASVHRDSGGFFGYRFTDLADLNKLPELTASTKGQQVWIVPTQSLMVRWLSPKSGAELMSEPEMQYMSSATLYQWRRNKDLVTQSPHYEVAKYERFIALREKILRNLYKTGAKLLLGSDAPQVSHVPGFSIHHEMQSLEKAGLSAYAILESGTVNPAHFFKASHQYGTVEEGKVADLLLLDANPMDAVENMRQLDGVMVRGLWLPKAVMMERLK